MRILAFVTLLVTISAGPCFAQVPGSAIDQLRKGHPEAAESSFSGLQTAFETGQATEYDLLDSYKVFYAGDPALAAALDEWVRAFPKSASAYLARGIYYRKRGEARRGEQYVQKTPAADLAYMKRMFGKSKRDLAKSLQLDNRAYLAALHLLNIAQFEGDSRAADESLGIATTILPSNFLARARYIVSLTPRWGGSYDRIDAFIAQCRSQGVPEPTLALLQTIKLDDQGHRAEENGQMKAAIAIFKRALPLSQAGGPRFRRDYMPNSLRFCSHYKFGGEYCS